MYTISCITVIQLFTKLCLPGHSLYNLLHPQRICTNLRSRGHNFFQLPDYCSALRKRSFDIRIYLFICLTVLNY